MSSHNRLVVDIGGGSTEFIIGHRLKPKAMESLYMGCVSFTAQYFPEGRIEKKTFKQAELAARGQVQTIATRFEKEGWKEAIGSSGTARSIAEILAKNGQAERGITADGLAWLRDAAPRRRRLPQALAQGLREDRVPVVAGGVAIMSGVFDELGLSEMTVAEGALRDGVLWDLLGRVHHRDIREVTIDQFVRRYHVDQVQAQRVGHLAKALLRGMGERDGALRDESPFLDWAVKLHEVGISIAQAAYHKHSAYILAFADMPGFSRQEQGYLSNLVLAQRGKLSKMSAAFQDDHARLATHHAFGAAAGGDFLQEPQVAQAPEAEGLRAAAGLPSRDRVEMARRPDAHRARARGRALATWESVGMSFEIVATTTTTLRVHGDRRVQLPPTSRWRRRAS